MYRRSECLGSEFGRECDIINYGELIEELGICFGEKEPQIQEDFYIRIDGHLYQWNIILEDAEMLFSISRKLWRQSEDVILTESSNPNFDITKAKTQILHFLSCSRYSVIACKSDSFKATMAKKLLDNVDLLNKTMIAWCELRELPIMKLVSPSVQNRETAISTYFHMYLEVKWLILSSGVVCGESREKLLETYRGFVKDLVCIAFKYYKLNESSNITDRHPFICMCIKECWFRLLKFSDKLTGGVEEFWNAYNEVLKPYDEDFAFWLLSNIALLELYSDHGVFVRSSSGFLGNISHVDQKLKSLLAKSNDDNVVKKCLNFIKPLFSDYWSSIMRIEPYQILWDYYFRHINDPYVKPQKSSVNLLEHVRAIKDGSLSVSHSSFDLFLSMLLGHLKKMPANWSKMRGRIYSRLSPNKLKDLNENGRYNISVMFLILADLNFDEMVQKLKEILEHFQEDKKFVEQLWIFHISVVTIYVELGRSINPSVAGPLLNLVEKASENRESYYLMKLYLDGLDNIINISTNFQLNQTILFGKWLQRYMQFCQYTDLCCLLNTMILATESIFKQGVWFEWTHVFLNNVLPTLKQISSSATAPSQVGKLAALLTRYTPDLLSQNLSVFTADSVNHKVLHQFLYVLLEVIPETKLVTQVQEQIIIQAWIRLILFSCEPCDQIMKKIVRFGTLFCLAIQERSQEPFVALINAIREKASNPLFNIQLKEICETCFGKLDVSIASHLSPVQSEVIVFQIYTNVAYLFYNCSALIYNKTKSNCLLSRLINLLLLPTEVLMGKSPNPFILKSIEKSWHLFFKGIFKLSYTTDPFLERTLKDLVVRYLPFFQLTNSPFFKCLESTEEISFILEKLSAGFIGHSSKTSEENTFKALRVASMILEQTRNVDVIKLVVQKVLPGVLEVVMFQNQKAAAIEIVKLLAISDYYVQVRQDLRKTLLLVMEKHLPFSSSNYFQMAFSLITLLPLDMKDLLPDLKKQITIVERMRGVGFDNTLRQYLERFETALDAQ